MKRYLLLVAALVAFASCNSTNNSSNVQTDETQDTITQQAQTTDTYLAPQINLPNRDGDSISLTSLRGNIVLVDFWASWCPPCRRENPRIVSMYNRVKDKKLPNGKKFIIYSVSLDDNKLAWVNAIKDDRLSWPNHVSDLKGWRSVVVAPYHIEGIPTNVLVDTTGAIIGRDMPTPEIELILQERLK